MNICVVGTGYVGLVTGAVFADLGNDVVCVDKDAAKIEALRAGQMPIYEPGLEEMVARNVGEGRLALHHRPRRRASRQLRRRLHRGRHPAQGRRRDRPHARRGGRAEIGQAMDRYKVVVNKSTVPVGTGELVREVIERNQPPAASTSTWSRNPEFLREGSAIEDFLRPDRIVIGAPTQQVADDARWSSTRRSSGR